MRQTMSLGFPPFTKAVKYLIIANAAVYLLMIFFGAVGMRNLSNGLELLFGLTPAAVVHGYVWQLLTYSFLHAGLFHLLFNVLALWMFGSQFEIDWGRARFLQFWFFCVVGAAITTVILGYAANGALGISPMQTTVGASGGIYGLLLAFGYLYGEREIMMFPLPFLIKAKYMVAGLIFIALVSTLGNAGGGISHVAHLGGLIFGWIYLRFLPKRGIGHAASEGYFGFRNRYYKWKRRRAARKFEVYMRKHDRSQYFDEYGNFRDPSKKDPEADKGGENRGPWIQ